MDKGGWGFRAGEVALLRAAAVSAVDLPMLPDLDTASMDAMAMVEWLRAAWSVDAVAGAVEHASPGLADRVRRLCASSCPAARDARRAVLALTRYVQRATGRATPFGWFSGVAVVSFASRPYVRWGSEHRAVVRAGAPWLARVIGELERCHQLLTRLPVLANTTMFVRDGRLIVPYQQSPRHAAPCPVEVSLAYGAPVQLAVTTAAAPIRLGDLQEKIEAEFPAAGAQVVRGMLHELVARRVLLTSLHAPSTETDALAHLSTVLAEVGAHEIPGCAPLVQAVRQAARELATLNARASLSPRDCHAVSARLRHAVQDDGQPLAVDLALDASLVLPDAVAREVERVAVVLTRLAGRPFGTPAWKAWHNAFYERYGAGTLVPVLEVLADSGLGYPDGYPDADAPQRPLPASPRDHLLLEIAQRAALDGVDEVTLDEDLISSLEMGPQQVGLPAHLQVGWRTPPHLEVGVRLYAADLAQLGRGCFEMEVASVSRAAGVSIGRFLDVINPRHRAGLMSHLAHLPGADAGTVMVQVSFPPLDATTAHVARAPQVLPILISLGEHRASGPQVLTPADLAVGCDGRRLYLSAPSLGTRIDALGMHALNLDTHTPALARFLIELCRANTAQVTRFDWGAARHLPFLPALRYRRTILAPARWRLARGELPERGCTWADWDQAFTRWSQRRRLPQRIHLVEGDQRLPLDLKQSGHRVLLRTHLDRTTHLTLTAVPDPQLLGWCDGRSHEITVPLTATRPTAWPPLPRPVRQRVVGPTHAHTPAASNVLLASLYGDRRRQDRILAAHLPRLLDRLDGRPWYYVRYRDPTHHLRLRVTLAEPGEYGAVAACIAGWADELRETQLLRDFHLRTSMPETGRWGDGPAFAAAEAVFHADSRAVLTQLRQPALPARRALVAAHSVGIAAAFTGSVPAGMRWLRDHIPHAGPAAIGRDEHTEATRLADPSNDWAVLRATAAGPAILAAWADRDQALAAYRTHFPGPHTTGVDVDDVLGSLLHVMFVRAAAIDFAEEAICLHLTRAAALTWLHRTPGVPA